MHADRFVCAALLALSLIAEAKAGSTAFVTNEHAGVSVIDLDQMTVLREIETDGDGPRGLGVSADGKTLITANKGTSDVSVLDIESGKLIRKIRVGKNVEFVRVLGELAYVTYEPSGPGAPGEAKKGKDDDDQPAEIAVVDWRNGKLVTSMKAGLETEGMEFSPDGQLMLVANEGDNSISVYERSSGKILRKIDVAPFGNRPRGIKISPDGKTYAVTLEGSDKLVLIDAQFKPIKSWATKKAPYGVSFDPEGRRIFVAAARANVIQVFDADSAALKGEIPVGSRCWHFSFSPDAKKLVVACGKSDSVVIADPQNYSVLKTLTGLKGPWGVVSYPRARGSIDTP